MMKIALLIISAFIAFALISLGLNMFATDATALPIALLLMLAVVYLVIKKIRGKK